eukprot:PhM_4_TR11154/c0_g1_i1/m.29011/K07542/PIGV; phosphatidylinositol glycan, class V
MPNIVSLEQSTNTIRWVFVTSILIRIMYHVFVASWDWAFADYDSSTEYIVQKRFGNDTVINSIGYPYHWDSVFFLDKIEHTRLELSSASASSSSLFPNRMVHFLVFMPGFPALVYPLYTALGVWGAVVMNILLFAASSVLVYLITMEAFSPLLPLIGRHYHHINNVSPKAFSLLCAKLWMVSPTGIFSTAFYCDVSFSFFTLLGIFLLQKRFAALSAHSFVIASMIRSNGILNAGFFLYLLLVGAVRRWSTVSEGNMSTKLLLLLYTLLPLIPYILYSFLQYNYFCAFSSYGEDLYECTGGGFIGLYSRLQKKHWDVGFMLQWRLINIPALCVAMPTFYTVAWAVVRATKNNKKLCFFDYREVIQWDQSVLVAHAAGLQLVAMCAIALFTMHLQVTPRFVSSNIAIYWCVAAMMMFASNNNNKTGEETKAQKIVTGYIVVWNTLGAALFSNFYPWT